MSSLIGIVLLGIICLFLMLFPLWQRRADRTLGTGIENDDLSIQWELEKDRLVKEQNDLDISLAEGKISTATHKDEREQVVVDAKRALNRLRQARSLNDQVIASAQHKPRAYRNYGAAFAGLILVGTVGLVLQLKGQDIQRQPPSRAQANPDIKMPDIKKMVSGLEARVKSGKGSDRDEIMLARSYLVLGEQEKATALYGQIHEKKPDNMVVVMALGQIYFNSKDRAQRELALGFFDKALAIEPDKPEALWFKSLALVRGQDFGQAKIVLAKLQVLTKDNPKAQRAVNRLLAELNKSLAKKNKNGAASDKGPMNGKPGN